MLVLARRPSERIVFPSIKASIEILSIKGNVVRLGVAAPKDVPVSREEIYDPSLHPQISQPPATADVERRLRHFLRNQLHTTSIGLALVRRQIDADMLEAAEATIDKLVGELKDSSSRLASGEFNSSAAAPDKRPSRRALLVEDNHNERELLASFLRLAGLEVTAVCDGEDALSYLAKELRPDVVLLDMLMPRCDGATTVRTIRANPELAGLKIFAVTGLSPSDLPAASGPGGVDRWFSKPLDPDRLLKELEAETCLAC